MAPFSRKTNDLLRDFLPPLAGLILIGILFVPAIKGPLDEWFEWIVGCLVLVEAALIVRALWQRRVVQEQAEPTLLPIYIHSDEERAQFRAMMGVKEPPSKPIKIVGPDADDLSPNQ